MSDAAAGLFNSAAVGVDYAAPGTEPPPVVDEPDKPPKAKTAVYDPGAYTVDEVEAYVAEHPDEAAAVLAAERGHRGRVTLIDWLEQQEVSA
jgi:hypothetical protein